MFCRLPWVFQFMHFIAKYHKPGQERTPRVFGYLTEPIDQRSRGLGISPPHLLGNRFGGGDIIDLANIDCATLMSDASAHQDRYATAPRRTRRGDVVIGGDSSHGRAFFSL